MFPECNAGNTESDGDIYGSSASGSVCLDISVSFGRRPHDSVFDPLHGDPADARITSSCLLSSVGSAKVPSNVGVGGDDSLDPVLSLLMAQHCSD